MKEKRTQSKITESDVSGMLLSDKSYKNLFHEPNLSRCNTDQYASILWF